jgi:hypothetical protein
MKYTKSEEVRHKIIHDLTSLMKATEFIETTLKSVDELGQMQILPWIQVSNQDRELKYQLVHEWNLAGRKCEALENDVSVEMTKNYHLRQRIQFLESQLDDWAVYQHASDRLHSQFQEKLTFLIKCAAIALNGRDSTIDWPVFITGLLEKRWKLDAGLVCKKPGSYTSTSSIIYKCWSNIIN